MIRVAINGFGRIGRNTLRAALKHSQYGKKFEIIAVNDLGNTEILAHLLKYDSIYGKFDGNIEVKNDGIDINGKSIKFFSQVNPSKLPWKNLDIDTYTTAINLAISTFGLNTFQMDYYFDLASWNDYTNLIKRLQNENNSSNSS